MRPGGYTLQHVLTPEAAGLVKQAVGLAHRRGHAQVTPLHVANTMLSSSSAGLLRSACLHSHSHPLQCKALELCLNVALNRLPSSSSSTSSLSNALVAAFKRAQAHQRRGSVEAHQKPIDVGQLVVSILNDPSVSRVMREAGFSSTQVKANVEIMNPNYKTTSTTTTTNTSFPSMGYHFGHQPSRSDMSCRVGITIPACSLELSLNSHDCDLRQGQLSHKRSMDGSDWSLIKSGELTCCGDCSAKLDVEIRSNHGSTTSSPTTTSSFPSWLYKQENSTKLSTTTTNHDQDHLQYVRDLFKKWNSICNSLHKNHHKTLNFSLMTSPSTSTTSSHDHIHQNKDPIIRSPSIDKEGHHLQRFKEFNTENLKSLSNSLERVVPWQSKLAPEIAGAVLQCRSGMMRRRSKSRSGGAKEDTWLLFQGGDVEGKEKVCRELARVVFSSRSKLTSIRMSSIFATRADSMEDMKNKRTRYDKSSALLERFVEEVRFDPHRVFMVEDVEQVDYSWWLSLKRSIEGGKVCDSNGEEVSFGDAIVVLSCQSFDSSSRACSLSLKQKRDQVEEEMVEGEEGSFDLNLVVKDHGDEGFAFDGGVGLVEVVDRCFFFKLKEDL